MLASYPPDPALGAEWAASLYRGADEYVVRDRDDFMAIVSGRRNDLM
ncbi:hypothetical protein GCM10009733_008110 [Nonomuraea maheshkhaliensis]|uniref:Uncharacterized protein n=1 Tax=Nonomuraea maheshkhaliensis TaxID=419590 RepID=A0ABN2EQ79_9ACTN